MRGTFRADIEGLRAVCVIAVVLYHAFPSWLRGGFIGVDIFFVISGYLITGLLLDEVQQTGGIDVLRFWGRRIRRILPAATFVLCCIAALVLLFPALDTRALSRHILAAAFFFHNIRQGWEAVDYLGAAHDDNPLLHYWSLSVEEQFYTVWPLAMLGACVLFRKVRSETRQRALIALIAGLWVASFAYSVHLTHTSPVWAFFDPFSRSWQLLSGAFLAAAGPLVRQPGGWLKDALGTLCLAVLAVSFVTISNRQPYPGLIAAVPTLAVTLMIHVNSGQHTGAAAALANPALRYIGRISFSWYLWHWPLLVFGRMAFGDLLAAQAGMIALSFLLAALTYRFVEQPVRHGAIFTRALIPTYALGAGLIGAGATAGVAMRHLVPDGVHIGDGVYVSARAARRDRPIIYADRCLRRFADVDYPACAYGSSSAARTVVLFGDSHAGNWFAPLDGAAKAEGWRLLVRIKASCRPIDIEQIAAEGGRERPYTECASWRDAVLAEIDRLTPDLIVVSGTGHEFPIAAERRVLERLAAAAQRAVIVRDTAWFPEEAVACLRKIRDPARCEWPLAKQLLPHNFPRTPETDLPTRARVLDLSRRICPDGRCRAVQDGKIVMFDSHHLTASFSKTLTADFRAVLADTGK
ncbi:MAG: acyltransferase family protein [Hyphomicrobiaceae bacterium]